MKIAYFDCFSGISGDMTLGALVDGGVDPDALNAELAKLKLDEFALRFEKVTKHGITGTRAIVETTDGTDHSHQHDDSPSESEAAPHHHHGHTHDTHQHHARNHSHAHHGGPSRHLCDIFAILDNSDLDTAIIEPAKQIFDRLAEAEAKVHDMPKDQVHLHEVSGIDAIVDIVGAVVGLRLLEIDALYASLLSLGGGFVRCAHGMLPVPTPGTLELLRGIPVRQTDIRKELVTPTGAAIISTMAKGFGAMPEMIVNRIGYGAGTRDLEEQPNLLRLCIGEKKTPLSTIRFT
ncbi:MAG: LarC family nickel insertion protein [Candidatus Poribacteria bacterium]|nr:LarC family nickel insertion protein [Candidatus Poribacteria bacterium]